jgi:hypothetical protein
MASVSPETMYLNTFSLWKPKLHFLSDISCFPVVGENNNIIYVNDEPLLG